MRKSDNFSHYHRQPCCSLRCDSAFDPRRRFQQQEGKKTKNIQTKYTKQTKRLRDSWQSAALLRVPKHNLISMQCCLRCCLVWPFLIHHSSGGVIAKVLQVSESTPRACLSAHYLWLIGQHVWSTCAQTVHGGSEKSARSRRRSWNENSQNCDLYLLVSLKCVRVILYILYDIAS